MTLASAVANTLAAIQAGVRQVEGTINGIGERAGNASAGGDGDGDPDPAATRMPYAPRRSYLRTAYCAPSKLLATITGFDVQPNKAIVGRNAFAHEAGIHQDGVLKDAATYEIMTPESVGWGRRTAWCSASIQRPRRISRQAARRWVMASLATTQLNDAFRRFKDLADRKKVVYDEDVSALFDDEVVRGHDRVKLTGLTVATGLGVRPMATLALEVDGARRDGMATGDGAVDATFIALRQAFPHEATLKLFAVQSVTGGTDAQARVTVRLEEAGKLVDGQGADTDTIVAAARAYVTR